MDENTVLQMVFRFIITVVLAPAVGWLIWQLQRQKTQSDEKMRKQESKMEDLEKRIIKSEQDHIVTAVKMFNTERDITEIKHGIDRLLDRRRADREDRL